MGGTLGVSYRPGNSLSTELMDAARVPLQRMLDMAGHTVGQGDVGRPKLRSDELDAGTLNGPQVAGE